MTNNPESMIADYVDSYCFRGDDGDYTPNENEQLLIEDALHGFFAMLTARQESAS